MSPERRPQRDSELPRGAREGRSFAERPSRAPSGLHCRSDGNPDPQRGVSEGKTWDTKDGCLAATPGIKPWPAQSFGRYFAAFGCFLPRLADPWPPSFLHLCVCVCVWQRLMCSVRWLLLRHESARSTRRPSEWTRVLMTRKWLVRYVLPPRKLTSLVVRWKDRGKVSFSCLNDVYTR